MSTIPTEEFAVTEVAVLARVLGNDSGHLPSAMARYYSTLEFGAEDKGRMHELAVGNQAGTLSAAEKQELIAYAKAGSLLSILKSRARQTLRRGSKRSQKLNHE